MKRVQSQGSILVVVMITLLFTAAALVTFLDKASNDLLVEAHVTVANRLRIDAYSSLEVTLGVLQDFYAADSGLHSASEGWGDPLTWAGWAPPDGTRVDVAFEDESGKLPLMHANFNTLGNMFQTWGLNQADAQHLADVLLSWMQQTYVPTTGIQPDYEQSATPYDPPLRPIRSYSELAAIDYAKEVLFDKDGLPNALWWRFHDDISLFNYPKPNINGANGDVLAAIGQFTGDQQQNISNYMSGTGDYTVNTPVGKQWFNNSSSVLGVVGGSGTPQNFQYTIAALRVRITVHEGSSVFHLAAVVAPQGGARVIQTTATDVRTNGSNGTSGETTTSNGLNSSTTQSNSTATSSQTAAASTQQANLQYPFTVLEILENDQILAAPPASASPST